MARKANDERKRCSVDDWENINFDDLQEESITDSEFTKVVRVLKNTILPCFVGDDEYETLAYWIDAMDYKLRKIAGVIEISTIPVNEKKLVKAFQNRGWTVNHDRVEETLAFSKYGRITLLMIL